MARGTTLVALLDMLRVTAKLSLNPAHNSDDRAYQVKLLQMEQERLWEDFDWPHLRVERQVPLQAGQRTYDTPPDIRVDRIEKIECFSDGCWRVLSPNIDAQHYAAHNSDLDERSWPPRRWKITEAEDIELWPISDTDADPTTREGYLKFTGIRDLRSLVADDDRADLDDQMLVNFVAAGLLTKSGAKDAPLKLDLATNRYARLRGRMTPRGQTLRMFGIGEQPRPTGIVITQYRPPGS